MVAGTKYRGDFEERIQKAMDEVKQAGNIILFIDEVHTLMGAGSAEGATDAANILKPALARGEIQVIGATTIDEYRKNIEKDAALERRFQPVTVGEPTEEQTVEILKGLRDKYEAHHKVKITDAAIENAVKMSSRYIADRFQPDKAIDLIDEACSKVRLAAYTAPPNLKEMETEIKRLAAEKTAAVRSQNFEQAAELRDKEKSLQDLLDQEKEKWKNTSSHDVKEVTPADIAAVVSGWTGIPVQQITKEESQRLLQLEKILHQRIVGQDKAVSAVARAIRRGRAGLKNPKRPMGSFIFLGPTGVGKTELCKTLAEAMFGDENAIIKLDMSEYREPHSISRLIGAPPGYVGCEEGGILTEAVKKHPMSVVVFDEIEKAHPDLYNLLLQILEDGRLTDSQGRLAVFSNTVVILTSNLGAEAMLHPQRMGFGDAGADAKTMVLSKLREQLRPELLGRLDETILFQPLRKEELRQIAVQLLQGVQSRLREQEIGMEFEDTVVEQIVAGAEEGPYGARPLRRLVRTMVEDPLTERLLAGELHAGDILCCGWEQSTLQMHERIPAAQ